MDISKSAPHLTSGEAWARFRFAVVSRLLTMPPKSGELATALDALAQENFQHPITKELITVSLSTIERWYYMAKSGGVDSLAALKKAPRSDSGRFPSVSSAVVDYLAEQHRQHPRWTYQLHHANLVAAARGDSALGSPPSYPTVRRFMQAKGLLREKRRRPGSEDRPVHEARETRSFEVDRPNALWHLDFHHGSRRVLTDSGTWEKPIGLAVLDDYSRVIVHFQWYLRETTETLVHALSQAILRFGVPLSLLTDNGGPMTSEEATSGLVRLGVVHRTTLPYSPHQNGKQETWFASLEGRLMAMLDGVPNLSLRQLNDVTAAWVLQDYNQRPHREIGGTLARHIGGQDAGKPAPPLERLRDVFRRDVIRTIRRSDGTLSLEGRRFEIPQELLTLRRVLVRYAAWDLATVHLVDERTGATTHQIYPLDKLRNSDGRRRIVDPTETPLGHTPPPCGLPPRFSALLRNRRHARLFPSG